MKALDADKMAKYIVKQIRREVIVLRRFFISLRKRFRRYNRYLAALDIFGLFSCAAIIFYFVMPESSRLPSSQDGMIANVLSELVGIWISVRWISYLVSRNERRDRVRVRIVRNMRMIERLARSVWQYKTGVEVENLRRELEWVRSLQPQRAQFLSSDEVRKVDVFYEYIDKFCKLIPAFKAQSKREPIVLDEKEITVALFNLGAMRNVAEKSILEETEEDSGL